MKSTAFLPRRCLIVALLVFATTISLQAQDWAKARLEKSPRHREYVTLTHGDRKLQAFVAYPEVKGKASVVIMIHEIFGLTDWAKEMADELAAEGFIVVAPDLLSGFGPGGGGSSEFTSMDATTKAGELGYEAAGRPRPARQPQGSVGGIRVLWAGAGRCNDDYRACVWFLCGERCAYRGHGAGHD